MRRLLAVIAAFFLLGANAARAQLSSNPTACVTPMTWTAVSNASAAVNLIVTPTNGAKVTSIFALVNDATSVYTAVVYMFDGVNTIQYGQYTITTGAGYVLGVTPVSYMIQLPALPYDSDGNPYLFVTPTQTLKIGLGSSSTFYGGGAGAAKLQIVATGCLF